MITQQKQVKPGMTIRQWRSRRNDVLYALNNEMGFAPSKIASLRRSDLIIDGEPATHIVCPTCVINLSGRLRAALADMEDPVLFRDLPLTEKLLLDKPHGRPITQEQIGRILRSGKPF